MTRKFILAAAIVLVGSFSSLAQRYFTKQGQLSFVSESQIEKIESTNGQANSVIDLETGQVQWAALIKAFKFEKALMEEHFNENYMESEKFPKATFKGNVENIKSLRLDDSSPQEFSVSGELTIHGVTQPLQAVISLQPSKDRIEGKAQFSILLSDFDIEIPKVVVENIAKTIDITVEANYEEFTK